MEKFESRLRYAKFRSNDHDHVQIFREMCINKSTEQKGDKYCSTI